MSEVNKCLDLTIELKRRYDNLKKEHRDTITRNEDYRTRIDKAIEYINDKYDYVLGDDTFLDHDEIIDRKQMQHILDILQGSDKE